MNPYGASRMQDNLHTTRAGQAYSGNHTASRTVLDDGPGSSSSGITGAFGGHNSAKRQKTTHPHESQFFADGGEWLVARLYTACDPERHLWRRLRPPYV